MTGNVNMNNNKIENLPTPTAGDQPATKTYTDTNFLNVDGTLQMRGELNMHNHRIKNIPQPLTANQAATKIYTDTLVNTKLNDYIKKDGTVAMTGDLNTGGHKILNLRSPSLNTEPATKFFADVHFLNLNGQTMNGKLRMGGQNIVNVATPTADNHVATKKYVVDNKGDVSNFLKLDGSTPMKGILNMDSHKITNVYMDHTSGTQATNKDYVDNLIHHSQVQPSHVKDQFAFLKSNVLEWTDEMDRGNSFIMTKIADLSPSQGNFHSYNHKVIYTTIIKNSQGA